MANSLTLTIGGDSSKLRADLALAQSQLRALTRELNATANAARRTGADLDFAKLGQAAGQFDSAAASVARLKSELAATRGPAESLTQELDHGFGGLGAAIREPLDALAMFKSSLRQTAEIAGVTFAVDEVKKWAKDATEAAERTTNLAAAVGLTPQEFSKLSGALMIAGGNADSAAATLEQLARNVGTALADPASTSAQAFAALGISQQKLKDNSSDLGGVLDLLAAAFARFADSPTKTAAFVELLGRNMRALIPAMKDGSAGLDELRAKAEEVGGVLNGSTITALADSAKKMHVLGVAASGLGSNLAASLKPEIDAVTDSLTSMIAALNRALGMARSDPASRLTTLTDELASVKAQIAEGSVAHTRATGRAVVTTPALPEGTVHRFTHGPRFGQIDTSVDNLATLRARATELQSQIDSIQGDMREQASQHAFGGQGLPSVPPIDTRRGAAGRGAWSDRASHASGGGGGGGRAGGGEAARQGYEAFAREEQNKLAAARGSVAMQSAILDEWKAKAQATFAAGSTAYQNAMSQIERASQQMASRTVADLEKAAQAIERINAVMMRMHEATRQAAVKHGDMSAAQAATLNISEVEARLKLNLAPLQQVIASPTATPEQKQGAALHGIELIEQANAQIAQFGEKARAAADALAKSFADAFDRIGSQIGTDANKLLFNAVFNIKEASRIYYTSMRTPQGQYLMKPHEESPAAQMAISLGQSMVSQLGTSIEGALMKSLATSVFGAGTASFGAGITKMLGIGQPGGLFGSGLLGGAGNVTQAASTTANTTALASLTVAVTANTAALTTGAAASVAGGGLGAASAAGSAGGLFSGIGSFFSLFARGGIVPAAAGGWALPSSFGSDRVMAALTPGEMVLPRHLSEGFQRMLGGGGGAGGAEGGGDVHLHVHGNIVDAPGVERFFKENKRHIAAVVQGALRSGAINPLA